VCCSRISIGGWKLDFNLTLLLTAAGLLVLALVILAGAILPVRSYTLLLELVRSLGSLVIAQQQEHRLAVTNLLDAADKLQSSALMNASRSMQEQVSLQSQAEPMQEMGSQKS